MYIFARLNIYNHITKFSKNNYRINNTIMRNHNKNDLSKLSKITYKMFCRKVLREGLFLYLNLQNDIFYKI